MFYFFILIIIICYFILSLIYLLKLLNSKYYKSKYSNKLHITKNPKDKCISGCKQGICHRGLSCKDYFPFNEECCNFNFECKECTDIYDNHIYKLEENTDVYKTPDEIKELNEMIRNKNETIRKQNDSITEMNKTVTINNSFESDNINITPDNITES